jgi:hypothetical protein
MLIITFGCKKEIKKSDKKEIVIISVPQEVKEATIDESKNEVFLEVYKSANFTKLCPYIEVSDGAQIKPKSYDTVDFSDGYEKYTITAEDGTYSIWTVFINPIDTSKKDTLILKDPDTLIIKKPDTVIIKIPDTDSIFDPNIVISYPDKHFDLVAWEKFISEVSSIDSVRILPLKDLNSAYDPDKVLIGLRHDIDNSIEVAIKMAEIEKKYGVQGTYYVLQTAPYYYKEYSVNMSHNRTVLSYIKALQNKYNQEIGIHNDLVTLQLIFGIDSKAYLNQEISWLRRNGINIYGTCAHGSSYQYKYNYLNIYFFEERSDIQKPFVNNVVIPYNGKNVKIIKGSFKEFNLQYEAYDMGVNYSDRPDTEKWDPNIKIHKESWNRGMKKVILVHPY